MRLVIAIMTLCFASPALASEKCDLFEDVVRNKSGNWIPTTGEDVPIANYVFALHGASCGHAKARFSAMGIR